MIGVFDSGVGGLTVLQHFLKDLPQYKYIYLGDNANVPYGNKSSEIIYNYSKKAVDFLNSQGCKIIIFACNSASSQALRRIQQEYLPEKYPNVKVLGVIRPIAEKIASFKNIKKIGIIGTKATINSNVYDRELFSLRSDIEIIQKATPLLVPLIEESWLNKPETKMILKKYLLTLKTKQIDSLILACTHYPFLLKDIRRIMGKSCLVLDPGKIVSDSLKDYLERHQEIKLEKYLNNSNDSSCIFYTTDDPIKFEELGSFFLSKKIKGVQKIELK